MLPASIPATTAISSSSRGVLDVTLGIPPFLRVIITTYGVIPTHSETLSVAFRNDDAEPSGDSSLSSQKIQDWGLKNFLDKTNCKNVK